MSSLTSTLILEGVVTSLGPGRQVNIAPMGPIVDAAMTTLRLRPFRTSTTYRNLKETGAGVLHVVDDVLLLAKAAIGRLRPQPPLFPAERIDGVVLRDACRWYEFQVESLDDSQERTEIVARVLHSGRLRDHFGFNRAKAAVIEAAILATRLHLLPRGDVQRQLEELRVRVDKTGGEEEHAAFALLERYAADWPLKEASHGGDTGPHPCVTVRTGARLHFGPLAVGASDGPQFGGIGMMLREPGFEISVRRRPDAAAADNDLTECPEAWREAVRRTVERYRNTSIESTRAGPVEVRMSREIPAHAGLGSGTQLGLAVGRALAVLDGPACQAAPELAVRVGRGLRSAVGIHGFDRGGLLIDGGKRSSHAVGTLVARCDVPDWGVVLITPADRAGGGLCGDEERSAFSALAAMPARVTERLCRIALLDLMPAVKENDLRAAGQALFDYGVLVGEYFAPAQGGIYAHPEMQRLANHLRASGITGVGQTSWGPTLFAFVDSLSSAEAFAAELTADSRWSSCRFQVARPLNRGAETLIGDESPPAASRG